MSDKSDKLILIPPNADLDALCSIYGIWLLNKDAKIYLDSISSKAKKLFDKIKDKLHIIDSLENLEDIHVFSADVSSIDFIYNIIKKDKIKKITLIDHHKTHVKDESIELIIDESVGSATTLVVEEIMKKNIPISKEDASILLCGIYDDTKYFSIPSFSPRDLMAGAFLMEKGADINFVNHHVKTYKSLKDIINIEKALSNIEILNLEGKKIGILTLSEAKEEFIKDLEDIKELEDLDAYFVIMESGVNTYVMGRSKNIDVEHILSKIGGAGHKLASGLKLSFLSSKELRHIILELLSGDAKIHLKDIMTKRPISLQANTPLEEALNILSNYKLSKSPVLDKEKILGVITKKILLKASKLTPNMMVGDYVTQMPILKEDDFIFDAEKIFIQDPLVSMIGVVDKEDKLVGIITKSDIIKHIASYEDRVSKKRVKLPPHIESIAKEIKSITGEDNIYLVGGVVRDILLNRASYDVDFVIEGDIDSIEDTLKRHGINTHRFGDFNSIHFKYKDFKIELSATRREYYESIGAYPVVSKASLKEDLFRRDFTINTMLISLKEDEFGVVIDFFGALNDLDNKIIRVLHPISFVEDPVRILRAIRFEAKLNFKLSKDTKKLLEKALEEGLLKLAPKGRILNEIKIALQEKDFEKIFEKYKQYKIIENIFGFSPDYMFVEKAFENLKIFRDWYLAYYKEDFDMRWIFFWLLIEKSHSKEELLKSISAPAYLYKFLELNPKSINIDIQKAQKPSEVYKILKPYSIQELGAIASYGNLESINRIIKYLSDFKNLKPNIDLKDIPKSERSKVIENAKLIEMDKLYSL